MFPACHRKVAGLFFCSMRYLYLLLFFTCFLTFESVAQTLYREEYRPQFHFSPQSGWIGDPDGLLKYGDTYHLFWWGHAESSDLVYWTQKIYPMRGDDGSFSYFTGSVVLDKNNTSGFGVGNEPMVAVYTAHNKTTGIQDQRLSYSTDHELFQYYSGNPVLTINSTEFRDPDVFWHEGTGRWIMAIVLAVDRKVNFYASPDLKEWTYLSSFGPVGARQQVWEVPQLIQLPVINSTERRWTLICSMGPNKMQYFVGDFDGTSFTIDEAEPLYLNEGIGLTGDVFDNFESGYEGWTVEGTAFESSPVPGTLPDQTTVSGFLGGKLVNSYNGGDASIGKLTSNSFTIERNNINFLVGGGTQGSISLVINGEVVRTASGDNSEALKWKGWDVRQFKGMTATLVISDNQTVSWGHILVDHIMFSDELMNTEREHARWIDWGADFYAARAYRNYDDADPDSVEWLGWMGNWEYANQVPTTWGRGFQSIPRNIFLQQTANGFEFLQTPLPALRKLRRDTITINQQTIDDVLDLQDLKRTRNTYEIEFSFNVDDQDNVGLNFFVGAAGKVSLGFDASTSTVYLDRRYSGNVSFSANFPKLMTAPVKLEGDEISFHVFVDQSSAEIFVNHGTRVISSLIFPYAESTGLQLFSKNGSALLTGLSFYPLKSIWGVEESLITSVEESKKNDLQIFPNPVRCGQKIRIVAEKTFPDTEHGLTAVISDALGREVARLYKTDGLPDLSLRAPDAAGMYHLDLFTDNKHYRGRLIVID
jgi:fructan beta-fructosidase